jgi:hypothetical protein
MEKGGRKSGKGEGKKVGKGSWRGENERVRKWKTKEMGK